MGVYTVNKCRHSGVLLESTKIENNKIASSEEEEQEQERKRNNRNTNNHSQKVTRINVRTLYLDLLEKSKIKSYFRSFHDVEKHEIFYLVIAKSIKLKQI